MSVSVASSETSVVLVSGFSTPPLRIVQMGECPLNIFIGHHQVLTVLSATSRLVGCPTATGVKRLSRKLQTSG
jgi:hypothetical protein